MPVCPWVEVDGIPYEGLVGCKGLNSYKHLLYLNMYNNCIKQLFDNFLFRFVPEGHIFWTRNTGYTGYEKCRKLTVWTWKKQKERAFNFTIRSRKTSRARSVSMFKPPEPRYVSLPRKILHPYRFLVTIHIYLNICVSSKKILCP